MEIGAMLSLVLAGLLYIFIKREFVANDKRWARIEGFLETVHKLSTKEELTNACTRLEAKLEAERNERVRLEKEIAVLSATTVRKG
jgi:predicted nuclease with TOPRIM domain